MAEKVYVQNGEVSERVLGVLAGDDLPLSCLKPWLAWAEVTLAADGGADIVLAAGFEPNIVVGDLDSLEADRSLFTDVRYDEDQYTTDCDKLLGLALEMGVGSITLACVEGSRPDHSLATLQSAARSSLDIRLLYRRGLGYIIRPGRLYEVPASLKVSLLPLTHCQSVCLSGVRWPLEDVELDPLHLTSISNEAAVASVKVQIGSGAALLFVEGEALPTW